MPSERFYIKSPLKGRLILEDTEHHHLSHVMRIREGETVELVNGSGELAQAEVVKISRKATELQVISSASLENKEPVLILAVALMRPSKLELIIEKCTELGASSFLFYPADFSEKTDLSEHQKERLSHVAISAMKQCGRLDLPEIKTVSRLEDVFQCEGPYFFGDLKSSRKWHGENRAIFITGPERGFSDKEHKFLQDKATDVLLHKNILRAETAPIAATCSFYSL